MRASPRKRSSNAPGIGPLRAVAYGSSASLVLALAAAWWVGTAVANPPPPGPSVEWRAVAGARQAAAKAETRARALNAMAAPTAARTVPVPARPTTPARAVPAAVGPAPRAGGPPHVAKPAPAVPGRQQVAAVTAGMRPRMNPVPAPSPSAAHLDDQVTYQYNALGRRDPFLPLIGGAEYVASDSPPDAGAIKVVGIVWGAQDKFAIIEDGRGNSTVLRPGDKVMNGVVEGLKRDGVIVNITVDGQSQSVTIPLTRKGDSNANR